MTIDRDALREIVADYGADEDAPLGATLDAILALLRPAEGVLLTPEEARLALDSVRYWAGEDSSGLTDLTDLERALVAKLEAGQ